jgi:ABC-type branched-subunit amino acid transport system permease subunit
MNSIFKRNNKSAFVVGVVLVFLIIFGLTTLLSEILGKLFSLPSRSMVGNTGGLMLFFGLIALWAGSRTSELDRSSLQSSLLAGLVRGLLIGLMVSALILLIGSIDGADVDMQEYLDQLSPSNVNLLLYDRSLWTGVLITLLIFIVFGVVGGLMAFYFMDRNVNDLVNKRYLYLRDRVLDIPLMERYQTSPRKNWINYAILTLGLLVIPQILGRRWTYAVGTVGIYVLMGLGLNIVVGLAGLLDLGYVAFFAIGAYTTGLLTSPAPITLQLGFWPVLVLSILFAALFGIILGVPVLRMRGDYLAIVTLGFGEIIRVLIRSDLMTPYLGGPSGIRNIAGPNLFGLSLISDKAYLYLIIIGIILTILFTTYLQNSRVGRAWMAMREDETVAQAMGINTLKFKLLAFATGAAFAGLGGALFAARNQYTGPGDHTLLVSINVLCLIIVGGMGSIPGVIVGAFVLKGLPEILRELKDYRLLAFGALLVIMMIVRPEGLWPAPRRRMELHEGEPDLMPPEKAVSGEGV